MSSFQYKYCRPLPLYLFIFILIENPPLSIFIPRIVKNCSDKYNWHEMIKVVLFLVTIKFIRDSFTNEKTIFSKRLAFFFFSSPIIEGTQCVCLGYLS